MVWAGTAAAYTNQEIPFTVTVVKDNISYSSIEKTTIKLADAPPKLNVHMFVTRPNSTSSEPYAGPYKIGEGIRVHVEAQIAQDQPCADRIIITAPVLNATTGKIENATVIDSAMQSTPWCSRAWMGAHWDYDNGFIPLR